MSNHVGQDQSWQRCSSQDWSWPTAGFNSILQTITLRLFDSIEVTVVAR